MDGFNIVDTRIENLNAGSYHVMWIDSLGCSGWLNAEVSEPEPLNAIAIVERYARYAWCCRWRTGE
jgi:hypothetical protein